MNITVRNSFHGTSASCTPLETYTAQSGQPCAVIALEDWTRMGRELCGMKGCTCNSMSLGRIGTGDDGIEYACVLPSAAL